MGNPASVKRKASEKRRKRYEQRLGPGVYLPKEEREQVNAEVAKLEAEAKTFAEKRRAEKAKIAADKKAATRAKNAEKAKAAPADKEEKPKEKEKKEKK
ncbi:MAG: hypothetical protein L0241_22865 [Planctomycetia bacterium]|nr:hypothetical protein [Planctomycetia bacterium]